MSAFISCVTLVGVATPASAASPVFAASGAKNWLIILAALAAGLGFFLLLVILFGGGQSQRDSAIAGRLNSYGAKEKSGTGLFGRFRFLRRAVSRAESAAEKSGRSGMISSALEQANIPLTPGEAIIAAIGIAVIVALIVGLVTQSFIWAIAVAVVVLVIASVYVNHVAAKQRKTFDMQLPDTLNLLSTSLRAGYSIMQAIEAAAQEAPEPTRREFGRAMAEIRLGRPMIDSLGDIAARMESKDFDWAVLAISIQREVGGNLAEVLQSTAETIQHRNRFRREVKALTAEGRFSMWIMALLPVAVFAMITVLNPGYAEPLYSTIPGYVMVGGAIFLMVVGIFWMQKIVKIEV
jgi:tight adherence protein B